MAIRMTGINSGLDTDSIVQALVSSYSYKKDKVQKAQTKLTWTQDAWKTLNTKVYSLYTSVSNYRFSSAYSAKKTSVSDQSKATVSAGNSTPIGSQKLNILKVAQSGYLTGGKIGDKVTSSTTLEELGCSGDIKFNLEKQDGSKKEISLSNSSTISDVVSQLKEAGVSASFDANNHRMYISSSETGTAGDFRLSADNAAGTKALTMLGLNTNIDSFTELRGINDAETSKNIQAVVNKYQNADQEEKEELEAKYDWVKDLSNAGNKIMEMSKIVARVNATSDAVMTGLSDNEKNYLSLYGENGADTEQKIKNILDEYKDSSTTAERKEELLKAYDFMKWLPNAADQDTAIAQAVKEVNKVGKQAENRSGELQGTKLKGQDAVIKLNGVEYTNSSNSFSINGLSITAQAVTGDGDDKAITVTTSTDTQGIYDSVKEFLQQYNTLINEMQSLYNADSAKGYEPLTDDEKAEMSDKEVEKWETKIKDALLRRDGTLGNVMNAMTTAMAKTFTINGKSYSLASFGIKTSGYLNSNKNEKYAYHIDGDKEDANTAQNADKLMAAIQEDPDTVVDFMKQLSTSLYKAIGDKMSSTTLSSAYTIYNDKQMTKDLNNYKTQITKWEKMVSEKEDYYYKKFSKMESALATLNSTQSSMSGFFG